MIPPKIRFEVMKRDNFTCQYCGAKAPNADLEIDHIMPISAGGSDDPSNLKVACWDCNTGKGARPLDHSDIVAAATKEVASSPWMDYATSDELRKIGALYAQQKMIDMDNRRDAAERRLIMRRCIKRMRRAEGKE